jgi:hypothetical protein
VREQDCVGEDVFGERALMAAYAANHAEDFVAGLKVAYACADCGDCSSHVEAENCGQRLPRVTGVACADLGIERIDAA